MSPKRYTAEQAANDALAQIKKHQGRGKRRKQPAWVCTNHMGTPKQQHKTRDAALADIMRRHVRTGKAYRVYPCPTSECFHVSSR